MKKSRVIIIDDDEDLLRLLIYAFQGKGFDVKDFATGKEAIAYIKDVDNLHKANLVVLDRMLPDMDGLDILKEIQHLRVPIPVLILSALSAEKDVLHGLNEGAIDYVTKPFSIPILMQKALALINRYTPT